MVNPEPTRPASALDGMMETRELPPLDERRRKALLKIMGEPVVLRLDDELAKTRLRLLVSATLSIGIVAANLHIRPDSTLLGLHVENLSDGVVRAALALITGYLLLHFLWGSVDGFREWRVRLTGTRYTREAAASGLWDARNPDGDMCADLRHSTLYNWWREQAEGRAQLARAFTELVDELRCMEPRKIQPAEVAELAWGSGIEKVNEVSKAVAQFRDAVLASPRIEESLKRYDAWHLSLARSENLRWIVFDFSIPTIAGALALVLLVASACR